MSDTRDFALFAEREYKTTRRTMLGAAAASGGGLLLAACGGSSSSNSVASNTATSPAPKKVGGTLRWGAPDGSTSDSIDPLFGDATGTNGCRCQALYDMLVRGSDQTAQPEPLLAEFLEPAADLSYWDVRVRHAEFHNGKPVTADDVIFSLQRVANPKNGAAVFGLLASLDAQRLQKLDSRTVRMHLHYPDIGIPDYLKNRGCSIIPVDFNPKNPIGSGPFKYQSFTPGQASTFVRNDNYWMSGKPYLDELQVIDFADPNTTRVNSLVSGQIDAASGIEYSLAPTVDQASNIRALISKAYQYITWEMRMDTPPFNDPRVRQAIKLIAGRPQIIEQAYSGSRFASLGNDWASIQDPMYDHSIPQRVQDIEQAKSLLKQAGHEGLAVELAVTPGFAPGVVETAEVLAQQAQAAGVTIKVNSIANLATYFAKYYAQAPFKFDAFSTASVWEHIGYSLLPGASVNISNWTDPQWLKLVTQARGTLNESQRKDLMGQAQQIFWDSGTQAVFLFENTLDAYSTKFTGFFPSVMGFGLNGGHFEDVGLA